MKTIRKNTKKRSKGFRNGKRVGKWRYYYESGNLKQGFNYSQIGERRGEWVKYDENGEIISIVNYK